MPILTRRGKREQLYNYIITKVPVFLDPNLSVSRSVVYMDRTRPIFIFIVMQG